MSTLLLLLACAGPKPATVDTADTGDEPTPTVVDADGDGWPAGEDCNDGDAQIHPVAAESCGDGVDQDCDGLELGCTGTKPASSSAGWVGGDDDQWGFGLGHAIAVTGDWSADGAAVMVAGAPWADDLVGDKTTSLDKGAVLAFQIDQLGPAETASAAQQWSIESEEVLQIFGEDLRLADLDGDSIVDLVVGAPTAVGHSDIIGDVYIYSGPITATSAPQVTDGIRIRGDRPGLPLAHDVNPEWDVTGDGHRDIVFDRPARCFEDTTGGFAILQGPDFESRTLDAGRDLFWDLEQPCWGYRHEVAVADFDGDGIGDVAMSAATGGSGTRDSELGIESDESGAGFVALALGPFTEGGSLADAEGRLLGPSSQSYLGTTVEVMPDFDGDGLPELLLGAPLAGEDDEGRVYIIPGPAVASWAEVETLASVTVTGGGRENLYLGQGVFDGGDQDADGHRELLVAATWSDPGGVLDESGRVYVFRGPLEGTLEPADAILTVHGDNAGDYLGYNVVMVGAGGKLLGGIDLNYDGFDDWLVGAELTGDKWRGAVYSFYGGVWD